MSDRSIAGTVGGKGKISSRKLKQLTETAIAQYAAAVSLERNPATFGDAVIDISNNLNVQSANAFSAVKRAFPSAFMDATLGADPAGIRQLPDNLVHLAGTVVFSNSSWSIPSFGLGSIWRWIHVASSPMCHHAFSGHPLPICCCDSGWARLLYVARLKRDL